MSLETAIAQNTAAVNALAEIVKQMMGMLPPTGGAPVTITPVAEKAKPVKIEAPAPKPEPAAAQPEPEATPAPTPAELRASLKQSIMSLYKKNAALGKTILDKFGVKNLSGLSDEQLPSFAKEVQNALQGI